MPSWLKTKTNLLKAEVYALYLAAKDPRTPWYAKAVAVLVVGYALSPFDIIPDFIPVLGLIDEMVILPAGYWLVVKLIPPNIMQEAREKAKVQVVKIKRVVWVAIILFILFWTLLFLILGYVFYRLYKK
jgi:uncharacterized membrane protein YkvA (DUF1232 family)